MGRQDRSSRQGRSRKRGVLKVDDDEDVVNLVTATPVKRLVITSSKPVLPIQEGTPSKALSTMTMSLMQQTNMGKLQEEVMVPTISAMLVLFQSQPIVIVDVAGFDGHHGLSVVRQKLQQSKAFFMDIPIELNIHFGGKFRPPGCYGYQVHDYEGGIVYQTSNIAKEVLTLLGLRRFCYKHLPIPGGGSSIDMYWSSGGEIKLIVSESSIKQMVDEFVMCGAAGHIFVRCPTTIGKSINEGVGSICRPMLHPPPRVIAPRSRDRNDVCSGSTLFWLPEEELDELPLSPSRQEQVEEVGEEYVEEPNDDDPHVNPIEEYLSRAPNECSTVEEDMDGGELGEEGLRATDDLNSDDIENMVEPTEKNIILEVGMIFSIMTEF
ncbi:hypothetical protein GIB67_009794 [Kingdonia uniflora]|uniref:Uncharacterized protein n=1 Tax=Kingdonia uniflora TaxID=39325 RepID=A0A7J7LXD0_9MAGN|nr:hypothetical protein GIB67_009794 [Kingdonia uniflora]